MTNIFWVLFFAFLFSSLETNEKAVIGRKYLEILVESEIFRWDGT